LLSFMLRNGEKTAAGCREILRYAQND